MHYEMTIRNLFSVLADCNRGDAPEDRQEWQIANDASQRDGAYGHIRLAIIALAGSDIVEYWAETNELIIELANRWPREKHVSLQELRYSGTVDACYADRIRRLKIKLAKNTAKANRKSV